MMSGHYAYRPHIFSRKRKFWLEPNAIRWARGDEGGRIAFRDAAEVRLYRLFMPGEAAIQKKVMWRLHLRAQSGENLVLSPLHYLRFRSWEDRSAQYGAFANRLLADLRQVNPDLPIIAERHWTMRWRISTVRRLSAFGGRLLVWLFRAMRGRDPDWMIDASAALMRRLGPLLHGHRVARANLAAAFPEKSTGEVDLILRGVWDNFGRVMAEYAYLDRLWDFDANKPEPGRIILPRRTLERAAFIRNSNKPALFFAAHLSNWELPAVAAKTLGVNCAVVYRPPEFGPIAGEVVEIRRRLMGALIPTGPGATGKIKQALDHGVSVAMLVDQHFVGGVEVSFFGRRAIVNPTLGRIARQLDCMVCGVRAIRLPGNRFEGELADPLILPRDAAGQVDVAATMQAITSVIEAWIREHPEQWLWMHRRWR